MNAKCAEVWEKYRLDLGADWVREIFSELAGEIERLEEILKERPERTEPNRKR